MIMSRQRSAFLTSALIYALLAASARSEDSYIARPARSSPCDSASPIAIDATAAATAGGVDVTGTTVGGVNVNPFGLTWANPTTYPDVATSWANTATPQYTPKEPVYYHGHPAPEKWFTLTLTEDSVVKILPDSSGIAWAFKMFVFSSDICSTSVAAEYAVLHYGDAIDELHLAAFADSTLYLVVEGSGRNSTLFSGAFSFNVKTMSLASSDTLALDSTVERTVEAQQLIIPVPTYKSKPQRIFKVAPTTSSYIDFSVNASAVFVIGKESTTVGHVVAYGTKSSTMAVARITPHLIADSVYYVVVSSLDGTAGSTVFRLSAKVIASSPCSNATVIPSSSIEGNANYTFSGTMLDARYFGSLPAEIQVLQSLESLSNDAAGRRKLHRTSHHIESRSSAELGPLGGASSSRPEVWFSFKPSRDMYVRFSTCVLRTSSDWNDDAMYLLTGNACGPKGVSKDCLLHRHHSTFHLHSANAVSVCKAGTGSQGAETPSTLKAHVRANTQYYLVVAMGEKELLGGKFTLTAFEVDSFCSDTTPSISVPGWFVGNFSQPTASFTRQDRLPDFPFQGRSTDTNVAGVADRVGPEIYFRFTPTRDMRVLLRFASDTNTKSGGSAYLPRIYVLPPTVCPMDERMDFTGSSILRVGGGGGGGSAGTVKSGALFGVYAGRTYYVAVEQVDFNPQGYFNLTISEIKSLDPATCPTVPSIDIPSEVVNTFPTASFAYGADKYTLYSVIPQMDTLAVVRWKVGVLGFNPVYIFGPVHCSGYQFNESYALAPRRNPWEATPMSLFSDMTSATLLKGKLYYIGVRNVTGLEENGFRFQIMGKGRTVSRIRPSIRLFMSGTRVTANVTFDPLGETAAVLVKCTGDMFGNGSASIPEASIGDASVTTATVNVILSVQPSVPVFGGAVLNTTCVAEAVSAIGERSEPSLATNASYVVPMPSPSASPTPSPDSSGAGSVPSPSPNSNSSPIASASPSPSPTQAGAPPPPGTGPAPAPATPTPRPAPTPNNIENSLPAPPLPFFTENSTVRAVLGQGANIVALSPSDFVLMKDKKNKDVYVLKVTLPFAIVSTPQIPTGPLAGRFREFIVTGILKPKQQILVFIENELGEQRATTQVTVDISDVSGRNETILRFLPPALDLGRRQRARTLLAFELNKRYDLRIEPAPGEAAFVPVVIGDAFRWTPVAFGSASYSMAPMPYLSAALASAPTSLQHLLVFVVIVAAALF